MAKYAAEAALPVLKPAAALHLDPWEHDEIFEGAEFTTLRTAAKHPKEVFDKILTEFIQTAAKKSIMVAMKTNLKGVERGTTKARAKFGGNVTQISDVVRATVVVTGDVKDLYDAVAMFKGLPALRSSLVSISNYDDRFRKPMGGGYSRDPTTSTMEGGDLATICFLKKVEEPVAPSSRFSSFG